MTEQESTMRPDGRQEHARRPAIDPRPSGPGHAGPGRTGADRGGTTTVLVMACTMATRLLGFVRNGVIAALFGTTGQADVLNGVFMIPNSFRKLLAEGALSSAFIPIISTVLVKEPESGKAQRLVRQIVSFLLLLLVPLLILAAVFSVPLVGVFLDLPSPELMAEAASLFRYLCHYLFLVSISAVLMGTLNSHGVFVIPALTPLFFSVAVIGSLLLFYRRLGIYAMAVGVLGGGLFQVLFQYPFFHRRGYSFLPDFRLSHPEFRRVLRLWLPVVATSSAFAVNQLVAVRFASGLETGSTTTLSFALVIFQLPFGVFSASIATVLFPRMSRQAAAEDMAGLRDSLNYGLRFLCAVLIPSTLFFLIMGRELVAVIYQRREFDQADTLLTARILAGYSYGMLSVGAFTLFQRFFYSLKDYRQPFAIAVFITVVDVGLSFWLKETRLRVVGLAVANSAAFSVGLILMAFFARRRLGSLKGKNLGLGLVRITLCLVPPTALLWALRHVANVRGFLEGGWQRLLVLLGGFLVYVIVAVFLYYFARVEIATEVLSGRWPFRKWRRRG